ncbi:MAG: TIGR01440 family protein [Acutalibacteraceae bacterium]|nr:TIGR01440 family protein [Acutalibacteraceae bacterium]
MLNSITEQAKTAITELIEVSGIKSGELLVIGCSSSEVAGGVIGKNSSLEAAQAVFNGIYPILKEKNIYIAAQCCEHLNRALIIEKEAADKFGYEIVNVCPKPKAGGSFATTVWQNMAHPVAVEHIKAAAGLDIGNTLIGMHLKEVAVPVRLSISKIGEAPIVCARTRPKFIGGERANYCDDLK